MGMTDPIADLLTRVRNAVSARHELVACPSSRMKERLCEVLRETGFIRDFRVEEEDRFPKLVIELKYDAEHGPAIKGIRRISKPGRRIYVKSKEIPRVLNGLGVAILSTSRGVLADKDARAAQVGGELICSIW